MRKLLAKLSHLRAHDHHAVALERVAGEIVLVIVLAGPVDRGGRHFSDDRVVPDALSLELRDQRLRRSRLGI